MTAIRGGSHVHSVHPNYGAIALRKPMRACDGAFLKYESFCKGMQGQINIALGLNLKRNSQRI
ncbi:isochorismatase family [Moniliophthora roreri]|nr:isochorismatase family [Moniliophthora roreri]